MTRLCFGVAIALAGDATAVQPFPSARPYARFIVAHADDEVLAAGARFGSFRKVSMIHPTDGAADFRSARARGFATRVDYAQARRAELRVALPAGGVAVVCTRSHAGMLA
jgi:LmbE family N-acetylglucosaminyl deacetylase